MADLEGAPRTRPSLDPIFFIFMQFLGKIGQNNRLRSPPLWLAHPPLGNPGSATTLDQIFGFVSVSDSGGTGRIGRLHMKSSFVAGWGIGGGVYETILYMNMKPSFIRRGGGFTDSLPQEAKFYYWGLREQFPHEARY